MKEPLALPPVLAEKIARTETASENLKMPIPIDLMASRESLYAAVRYSSRNLFDIESRAHISAASLFKHLPAPLSSLLTGFPQRSRIRPYS